MAGMRRRIAIVGANGFVGSQLVALLVRHGVEVTGVVRSSEGARVVRELGGRAVEIPDLGPSSTAGLVPILAGSAGLVYTASVAGSRGAGDRTEPSGLLNVLAACREAEVPNFVFLSGLGIAHYGMNPHCTNPYFLAKMAGEVALFRSGLSATVFRPSYIFGPGDQFLSPLIRRMAADSVVEIPASGQYRLQPISVEDTARAIEGALETPASTSRVVDLVGPEALSYRDLITRVGEAMGREIAVRERPLLEALAEAERGGYFGLRPHDLACLLCDEVSDPGPVESLTGQTLQSVDAMIAGTVAALGAPGRPA